MAGPSRGHGTEVRIGSTGNLNSFTTSAGGGTKMGLVGDISGPDKSADPENVTHHDSSGSMDWIAGLVDEGSVSWTVRYDSTDPLHGSTELINDIDQGNNRDIRLVMPSSIGGENVIDTANLITNVGNEMPAGGGAIERSFETQVTAVSFSTST